MTSSPVPRIVHEYVPNISYDLPVRIAKESPNIGGDPSDDLAEDNMEKSQHQHEKPKFVPDSCGWERIPGQREHILMSAKGAEEMFPKAFQHNNQSSSEAEDTSQDVVSTTNATASGNSDDEKDRETMSTTSRSSESE